MVEALSIVAIVASRQKNVGIRAYSLEDTRCVAQGSEDVDGVALVRLDDGTLDVVMNLGFLGAHEARSHYRCSEDRSSVSM